MIDGLFQPTHLVIILVMVLILFGPGKLPEVGSALGRGIREFKHSVDAPTAAAPPPALDAGSAGDAIRTTDV